MGKKKKKDNLSEEDKRIMAEAKRLDQEMKDIRMWTHCLSHAVNELETEASLKYLAQKAHRLLAKEHHDRGDLTYPCIFRDPDRVGHDPGG